MTDTAAGHNNELEGCTHVIDTKCVLTLAFSPTSCKPTLARRGWSPNLTLSVSPTHYKCVALICNLQYEAVKCMHKKSRVYLKHLKQEKGNYSNRGTLQTTMRECQRQVGGLKCNPEHLATIPYWLWQLMLLNSIHGCRQELRVLFISRLHSNFG